MPEAPQDSQDLPDRRTPNAPAWAGRPGWVVYAVTGDAAAAAARAAAVAAAHRVPLATGLWPVDGEADTHRLAVGPVYVAVRTRGGHANGAPVPTYYVLRRWVADEIVQAPDPAWAVPSEGGTPAPWPFAAVGRRTSRAGSKTLGADIITWRGPLDTAGGARTITFTTRPRTVDPHASFLVSANARIHYATVHPEFVDLLVHHPLGAEERAELAALAQAHDSRPVVVRCVGEPLRGGPGRESAGDARPRRAAARDGAQGTLPLRTPRAAPPPTPRTTAQDAPRPNPRGRSGDGRHA